MKKRALLAAVLLAAVLLAACSGKSGSGGVNSPVLAVSVSPPSGTTLPNAAIGVVYSQTFTILTGGTPPFTFTGTAVPPGMTLTTLGATSCAVTGAPTVAGTGTLVFAIVDSTAALADESYGLTITGTALVSVAPSSLPNSTAGSPYQQTLTVTGGTAPYTWSFTGTLPTGVALGTPMGQTNTLSGTTLRAGTFSFSIQATDANGISGTTVYNVTVM